MRLIRLRRTGHDLSDRPTTPNNNRGIIGHTNDSFTITNGGTELIVQLTANFDGFKELRVFTAGGSASGVPEPASLAIWSLVGTVFVGRKLVAASAAGCLTATTLVFLRVATVNQT